MKKFIERIIEGALLISSTVTTLTVLLITIFLFKEGISLFNQSPLEGDNIITVSASNPVDHISSAQIKNIFDQKITHWDELGGKKDSIILFTFNDLSTYFSDDEIGANFEFLPHKIDSLVSNTPGIIAVFSKKYLEPSFKGKIVKVENVTLTQFLSGEEWFPTANPAVQLGVLPLILGTLWVSLIAIVIALPIGLATAIYLAEVANQKMRNIYKPIIELLAGIPSVVYGFFGLIVIVPMVQ